jgi:maltose alpha-D-glucosyltransferase/alpha-amylase
VQGPRGNLLVDVFADNDSEARDGRHTLDLEPYAWRWFKVGSPDNALYRTAL